MFKGLVCFFCTVYCSIYHIILLKKNPIRVRGWMVRKVSLSFFRVSEQGAIIGYNHRGRRQLLACTFSFMRVCVACFISQREDREIE